jgi:hypothetical protein
MLVRQRVEGLNEALCPGCNRWLLLSWFVPVEGDLLSQTCRDCREAERAR